MTHPAQRALPSAAPTRRHGCSRSRRSARHPRRCSTTTSTAACGRQTIVDLAAEFGYDGLPTTDPDELAAWIRRGADRKSLELYLETFAHTVGVLQERDAIIRVAAECAEDLAADGVVYAEVRYAPELSTERGLTLDEVVEANLEGFRSAQSGPPRRATRSS